ncbi:transcription factor [Burkholderia gladioli]|nr:transcription factor [Burkholderia gladioli pv. gladioli]PEH80681.1 transcription factor [Burkholderia gladioli]PRE91819.1 transcription factor [Burkholderia gladioli]
MFQSFKHRAVRASARERPRTNLPIQGHSMTVRNDASAGPLEYPWSLTGFPNYEASEEIDSLDARDLSQEDFHKHYVMQNLPCRVRGAAAHWPAFRAWRDPEYFKRAANDIQVEARHYPCSELIAWVNEDIRQKLIDDIGTNMKGMPFHAFLDEMKLNGGQLVLDACEFDDKSPLAELQQDITGYTFLRNAGKPRVNPLYRAFLYRGSYTDWHFHAADETLMTQVVGAKEVLILPPDDVSWQALLPVIRENGYLFDVDSRRYAGFSKLRPYRVLVEPGDALYIPVFWWHAVESVGTQFGVTVARTFASPLHINGDWQYPAVRKLARTYALSPFAPLLVGALAYALAHKVLKRIGLRSARR